jgi:hypothetical protein
MSSWMLRTIAKQLAKIEFAVFIRCMLLFQCIEHAQLHCI